RRMYTAERQRGVREREFTQVVRHTSAGIARVALDGRVLWANPRLLDMLGLSWRDVQGMDFRQLVPADEPRWAAGQLGRLLVGEIDHYVAERRCLRPDGHEALPVLCTMSAIPEGEGGEVSSLLVVL